MIKVQNNVATREALPDFLMGLAAESLLDLSWTDPALGVQDCAWWPEDVEVPTYDPETHKVGDELLTIDVEAKVVRVTYAVVPLTPEELAERRKARTPQSVAMWQARSVLIDAGLLDDVEAFIAAIPDPVLQKKAKAKWEYSNTVQRNDALLNALAPALGLDEAGIDHLFITAASL